MRLEIIDRTTGVEPGGAWLARSYGLVGYWVMEESLSPGLHTIQILARPSNGRWLDVPYQLTEKDGQ